jgi:hypothetical protein
MSRWTKPRAKKLARKTAPPARSRLKFRADLPPITPASPLYGLDDIIGSVSAGLPSDKASRRAHLRSRIHADNHNC